MEGGLKKNPAKTIKGGKRCCKTKREVGVVNKLILRQFFAESCRVYALRLLREVSEKVVNTDENIF